MKWVRKERRKGLSQMTCYKYITTLDISLDIKKKVKATEKQIHWGVDTTFLQLEFSLWENEKNRAKKAKWLGLQNEMKPF